jgi:ABC-type transporter Mla subunit MlaD
MDWLSNLMASGLLAAILRELREGKAEMQKRLDELKEVMSEVKGNTEAVVAAIENLAAQLDAAKDDPDEVAALAEELRGINETLSSARDRAKKSK